eukprot:2630992-Pleurochrysis_carterae.AAC.1
MPADRMHAHRMHAQHKRLPVRTYAPTPPIHWHWLARARFYPPSFRDHAQSPHPRDSQSRSYWLALVPPSTQLCNVHPTSRAPPFRPQCTAHL